ncbi:MAG: beta-ketoacyl synthase chain length factor [Bdellovibrionales bacterium]
MTPLVTGVGVSRLSDLENYVVPSTWRKATRNIKLAVLSMQGALAAWSESARADRAELGLVVGTSSGELETSADFLLTLARSNVARPLLFQNSLHNATAGFASIEFGITGPAFTLSADQNTPGECITLAQQLLGDGYCQSVLITLVEVHQSMARFLDYQVKEAAATMILSTPEFANRHELKSLMDWNEEMWTKPYQMQPGTRPLVDLSASDFFKSCEQVAQP